MEGGVKFIIIAIFVCLLVNRSRECGPGPSVSRLKIRKPMVLYQRLPDVDEESISGSGMFRRIIRENSQEHRDLVHNHNKDIVFESGEGKRVMTKRCREKIDKLATLVKHEWPNVKLRVIEAYDKYGQHPPNSLHYEARAVDITTSDRDKSKIGNLGSLAFQAGFDWVYYESHSFIHASVVSEKEVSLKQAECFPGSAKIRSRKHGLIELESLAIGDHVQTQRYANGRFEEHYTEVIGFLDAVHDIQQPYLTFQTEAGLSLDATRSHLIYTGSIESSTYNRSDLALSMDATLSSIRKHAEGFSGSLVYTHEKTLARPVIGSVSFDQMEVSLHKISHQASDEVVDIRPAYMLAPGDELIMTQKRATNRTRITKVTRKNMTGAFAPLTDEGSLLINDVLVSCYAKIDDAVTAHRVFMPYRYISKVTPLRMRQNLLDWYVHFLRAVNDLFSIFVLN